MDYWPMAREYSVWNAAVAALQFWEVNLEAHILSSAINQVFNAFFYSISIHVLCQQSDKILFSCFMTMLNATFKSKLALEDEGYESSSENSEIPTPLQRTSRIHHISSVENASFDPVPVTPHSTRDLWLRPVGRRLTYSSSDNDETTDDVPSLAMHSQYSTMDVVHNHCLPHALFMPLYTWKKEKMEKRTSKLFQWMMNIGPQKKFLADHYVYMNIYYHTDCVHIWIINLPLTVTPWI